MPDKTSIAWTEATWNPIRGCSRVSAGCMNCYAERIAMRFSGAGQPYDGLVKRVEGIGPRWTGKVRFVESALDLPTKWRQPRRIFVNSMSDLFHEQVEDEWVLKIFQTMGRAWHHTYQILTKRPERIAPVMARITPTLRAEGRVDTARWHHVWIGTSVEDQETADRRIPHLLTAPASVRWVSYEPALGPVNFHRYIPDPIQLRRHLGGPFLDWIVVGGESGPRARPFDLHWARQVRDQCSAAGVPFFMKQAGRCPYTDPRTRPSGERWVGLLQNRKGEDPAEWPADLRIREYPR